MNDSVSALLVGIDEFRARNRQARPTGLPQRVEVRTVLAALHSFGECVRYLNTRRSSGALLTLDSEASIQDVLYLMLRPWVTDLVPENPTDRIANRYSIKDFLSQSNRLVVEAKFIR